MRAGIFTYAFYMFGWPRFHAWKRNPPPDFRAKNDFTTEMRVKRLAEAQSKRRAGSLHTCVRSDSRLRDSSSPNCRYSHLIAAIGSTRIARLAGT